MTTPNPFAAPEPADRPAAPAPGYAPPPGYGQQPYVPPPGYGQPQYVPPPGYGQPYAPFGVPVAPPTNGFAIAALVCGILGCLLVLPSVLGVVFGHVALSQIGRRGEQGKGLAVAGLVTGYLGLTLLVLIVFAGIAGAFVEPGSA